MLAFAVVAILALFAGQIPLGQRTLGAHVVERARALVGWVGRESSRSAERVGQGLRRGVSSAGISVSERPRPEVSDDDLVSESDRRSLMRLLE